MLMSVAEPEDAIRRVRAAGFTGTLVVALAEGAVADAVAAMRAGADDVVQAPVQPEQVVDRLLAATPARRPERRRRASRPLPRGGDFCGLSGRSEPMLALYAQIERLAASRAPVFVTGACGSGKDLVATALHVASPRQDGPFVALNCAAIPPDLMEVALFGREDAGALERAQGGTLHLDEVTQMEPATQAKLLHFVETGRFRPVGEVGERDADVRLVCATSRDPLEETSAGRLRGDLYYRLNVLPLAIPPLRARGDDVLLLAETFLARFAGEEGRPMPRLTPEAVAALRARTFRGNVRELQNLMRRAVVLSEGGVLPADLFVEPEPATAADAAEPRFEAWMDGFATYSGRVEPLAVVERRAIEAAIAAFDGNISLAAAALDLSPSTLYRKKLAWQERTLQS
ncbi:sigma-54 dependent transcriptional regulator [Xanthobacter sp. KR7-65]|uniref:sigma-54-dependent transcriptional regulator n=1 Tax=Xanthobacter sp. KR7-65 TaxID=3156612 RepID=UPI0032B526BF